MVLWLYTTYYEGALLRPVGEYYGYTLPLTMGRVLWLYTTTHYGESAMAVRPTLLLTMRAPRSDR